MDTTSECSSPIKVTQINTENYSPDKTRNKSLSSYHYKSSIKEAFPDLSPEQNKGQSHSLTMTFAQFLEVKKREQKN